MIPVDPDLIVLSRLIVGNTLWHWQELQSIESKQVAGRSLSEVVKRFPKVPFLPVPFLLPWSHGPSATDNVV